MSYKCRVLSVEIAIPVTTGAALPIDAAGAVAGSGSRVVRLVNTSASVNAVIKIVATAGTAVIRQFTLRTGSEIILEKAATECIFSDTASATVFACSVGYGFD